MTVIIHIHLEIIRGDHLILNWGGGVGAGKFCSDRLFIFSISPVGKFIPRPVYLFSPTKKIEKQKKPRRGVGGGGVQNVGWFRRDTGQDFPCNFFIFLQTTPYSVYVNGATV